MAAAAEAPVTSGRLRVWFWYAPGWVPVAALNALMIVEQRGVNASAAVQAGVLYVAVPALLGVAIWWLSGALVWPSPRPVLFFTVHLLGAVLFSALWVGAQVLWIAVRAGTHVAMDAGQI